jgi:hypothetical protein
MLSITRDALIDKLTELEPRAVVEPQVDRAIEAMGWQDKPVLTATEVIALGTMMAELAREDLASSDDPADRRAASEMKPLVEGMASEVVPVLNAIQAEKAAPQPQPEQDA